MWEHSLKSDFDIDLAVGHEGEILVKELLTHGKTIEVKKDLKWKHTGNLYIETMCWSHNNQQWYSSGLSVTKAEYWAFVLDEGVLMLPTGILKTAVADKGRAIACNIEPNPSKGYLIKIVDILGSLANAKSTP
jgi:hypothetical protein